MSQNPRVDLPSARILIVEDEAIVAEDLRLILEDLGYTVLGVVATGVEAVQAVETLRPDLVLMDIRLRGAMDGIQAADHISRLANIPIIFVTAHSDRETQLRLNQSAISTYRVLFKPFSILKLRQIILDTLSKPDIQALNPPPQDPEPEPSDHNRMGHPTT